jgi:reductive dehalogenase
MAYSDILIWIICTIIVLFFLAGSVTSFFEKEARAGIILLLTSVAVAALCLVLIYIVPLNHILRPIFLILIVITIILFTLPIEGTGKQRYEMPIKRFHEADAVLSRRKLLPGSDDYKVYYELHPEYQEPDDQARSKPGLLSEDSKYYDPGTYNAAKANFILTDHLHSLQELSPNSKKAEVDGDKTRAFIEQWLLKTGAHSVGFTELKDYHLYSHQGRGENRGKKIVNDMPHAVAITVEMDHDMMKPAPAGTTVMESSEQYLQSGILASKLCSYIKNLGYNARTHIDGQYEVICPLVAADAGLGMIGRMGLLMTPSLGPRVRIAVVTTDIPLDYESLSRHDLTMLDFCNRCQKCAKVCPADAISKDPLKEIDGSRRWKINSEGCYLFWTISGTDCGRCVISCPYAHPDNWFHRFIRWGIKNNLVFRVMAVKLDNIFYGKKPKMKPLPKWVKLNNK